MNVNEPLIDDVVFEYLEMLELSEGEAAAFLEESRGRFHDGGAQLTKVIERLESSGLLAAGQGDDRPFAGYMIKRRIGRGGMGDVFLAERSSTGEAVALKTLRVELQDDATSVARFEREVAAVRRLDHPSIARVLDVGNGDGIPFLAFELVDGMTLENIRACLAREHEALRDGAAVARLVGAESEHDPFRGELGRSVAWIGRELLGALAHAHANGVIHRDVKLANAMLTPSGRVVLLDFGLAGVCGAASLTATRKQVGSLPAMAPEIVRGDSKGSVSADVYAVGIALIELCTGQSPFEARRADRLAVEIMHGVQGKALGSLPPGLRLVAQCAVDPDPSLRYPSAEAMAADLTEYLEGRQVAARAPSNAARLRRWARRHPALSTACGLLLTALVIGPLAFGFMQRAHARETNKLNVSLAESLKSEGLARSNAEAAALKAIGAIRAQLQTVAAATLEHAPATFDLRMELVGDGLRLAEGIPPLRSLRAEVAYLKFDLLRTRAVLEHGRLNHRAASAAYEEALAALESLEPGEVDRDLLEFATSIKRWEEGAELNRRGEHRAALAIFETEIAVQVAVLERSSVSLADHVDLAQRELELAAAADGAGERGRGDIALDSVREQLASIEGDDAVAAKVWLVRSLIEQRLAGRAAAVADYRTALGHQMTRLKHLGEVMKIHPLHRIGRYHECLTHARIADYGTRAGQAELARSAQSKALASAEQLVADYPTWSQPATILLASLGESARLALHGGDVREAFRLARECVARWRTVERQEDRERGLVTSLCNLATVAHSVKLKDEAMQRSSLESACESCNEAFEILRGSEGDWLNDEDVWVRYYTIGRARALVGDLAGAREALVLAEEFTADHGIDHHMMHFQMADAWCTVARAMNATGDPQPGLVEIQQKAIGSLASAVERGYSDREELEAYGMRDVIGDDPQFGAIIDRMR